MTVHSVMAHERRWSAAAAHAGVRATRWGDARRCGFGPTPGRLQHGEPVISQTARADPGTPGRQNTTSEREQDTGAADASAVCDPPITEGGPAQGATMGMHPQAGNSVVALRDRQGPAAQESRSLLTWCSSRASNARLDRFPAPQRPATNSRYQSTSGCQALYAPLAGRAGKRPARKFMHRRCWT